MPRQAEVDQNPGSERDRKNLAGLLGFAEGVLNARTKVQMVMQTGMGVFLESDISPLPGMHMDCDDGTWLRIDRQRETRPPDPLDYVAQFLVTKPFDPTKKPSIKPAISLEVTIEDASDLAEAGLLLHDDVHPIMDDGIEIENRVKIVLHAKNLPEMRRAHERYVAGPWADWAEQEKPVRRAISLYNDLFKIHSAIHTADSTPPELIWGIGIGRWKIGAERVDMPLLEQMVDIEVEAGGAIAIRPRDLAPQLSLKPYLEAEIDGSPKLQRELQQSLAQILQGDAEFSPFTTVWEPILDAAASNLSSTGAHISRAAFEAGETLAAAGDDLKISSSWAIFGRPRSTEARAQDLHALRMQIEDDEADVPSSIQGFAATPPAVVPAPTSDFGLDDTILSGVGQKTWEPSSSGDTRATSASDTSAGAATGERQHRVHFFPLPFNEEQGKISDMIDDKSLHVACVSGPPGTGKSHSIANIISHQMALGKRVLVTARTPEAIAAVREKLPKSLQPLVIASVGTDRESAQQLQEAVTELSREVVSLDVDHARQFRAELEQRIIDCDAIADKADRDLADIARANLHAIEWGDLRHTPMALVDLLAEQEDRHGWFTDRPEKSAAAQLDEPLLRLKESLPSLSADIVYADAELPSPDDLPATAALVAAHESELAWNTREIVDYSNAPAMALDNAGAIEQAAEVLNEMEAIQSLVSQATPAGRAFAILALKDAAPLDRPALEATLKYLTSKKMLEEIAAVRFDLGDCADDDFLAAATRGASGQKPVGFGFFNGALKSAVGSARVSDKAPASQAEWRVVLQSCRLQKEHASISDTLRPFVGAQLMPALPDTPWMAAAHLISRRDEIQEGIEIANRLRPLIGALGGLFPYGLDLTAIRETLDCSDASFAIRGNIPNGYVPPDALLHLRRISNDQTLPVFIALRNLAAAIGQADTNPNDIIAARREITNELTRLVDVAPRLRTLSVDLDQLAACGAPHWVQRLTEAPDNAPDLIPEDWREAWAWAQMKGRIDRIIALGNGDSHRKIKSDAMARRRKHLEDLIRIRTLLGLKQRMTAPIRQAMEAFTQAVSKIGTGRGKRAPRFIRAAQEAAKQASTAAPVWIMPEYKIPEQLPAEFGDFDLVILDEASQSDVTALAALARGKKILVVGDEEQVSPSVVGVADQKINALRAEFLDGLPNSSLIDQNTSIFELTKRMHPDSHVMLREHFRCVAPIIQFSTRFYNNALVPLRVPKASERFDPPLADVYIPGATRQGKTNAFEARWIVDEIARLIADPTHTGRDIGVISLIGAEQAEKIGRILVEDVRVGPEQIEKRRIIYGDARTMQGQERSIVFLSMVATPGNAHAQTMKSDQQRINVAMSRAKDRLYLVRSVEADDLKPTDIKSDILRHFVDPMPDGRAASKNEVDDLMERCDSPFEQEVLGRLMAANYRVRPQVAAGGFRIDLVVEGMDDRRLAIELDGDLFHGPDVWDRDMIRQAALERAGWVFWRVFGSQWASDKDFWWANLCNALDQLKIDPIGATAVDERFTETILVDPMDIGAADAPAVQSTETGNETRVEAAGTPDPSQTALDMHGSTSNIQDSPPSTERDDAVPASTSAKDSDSADPSLKQRRRSTQHTLPRDIEEDLFSLAASNPEPVEVADTAADAPESTDRRPDPIRIGDTIRLEKLGNGGGKLEITLVDDGHDANNGMIGIHTPLGQALLDAEIGDEVEYRAGAYVQEVRVLSIS